MRFLVGAALIVSVCMTACSGANPSGSAVPPARNTSGASPNFAAVSIDAKSPSLATANGNLFGANLATSMSMTSTDSRYAVMMSTFQKARFGMVRIPLALLSDYYDWKTNAFASCVAIQWQLLARTTFDDLMQQVIVPLKLTTNVTIDYGSNMTCSAGGDSSLAAAWVDHANNVMHYGVRYWSIGNEMYYGSPASPPPNCCSTPDFNVPLNNATLGASVYARRIATEFYPLMKAKDPSIKIGVDLLAGNKSVNARTAIWDATVLAKAKYDFVEVHWYPDKMSDADLLTKGISFITSGLAQVRSELAAAGKPHTPIFLGEWGLTGDAQWSSIVGALYTALALGELEKGGVGMAGIWEGWNSGPCFANSSGFYSKQNWSTDSLFEAIEGGTNPACPSAVQPPLGTAFPRANAIAVVQQVFQPGDEVFAPSVRAPRNIRVYGARRKTGYGVLLVNISQNKAATVTISVEGDPRKFKATNTMYDKALYDESADNVWAPPLSRAIGTVKGTFSVRLPSWSVTAVVLKAL